MSNADSTTPNTLKHTPLFEQHQKLNARIVDFGGWALPVAYGSQIEEHLAVRQHCGLFDVSHMTVSDLYGSQSEAMLCRLLANDIRKTAGYDGKALYSCMLNEQGGVIDDLIVYRINDQHFRLVTNAGTREKDLAWINHVAQAFDVELGEQEHLALIAVQGPQALSICTATLPTKLASLVQSLKRFEGGFSGDDFIGRTGYTGEDGFEIIVDAERANELWQNLIDAKVTPCGLGARDTLRLEAGMSLYGNDLDEEHTPLESGLAWTVALSDDRDFIGKSALSSSTKHMIGLILIDKGVLRSHQSIMLAGQTIGHVTSGTFSPSLQQSIALARLDTPLEPNSEVDVAVRKKRLTAKVVIPPFYKSK